MTCDRIEELLTSFVDGELRPEDKALVEGHLRTCPECAALLSFLKSEAEAFAAFPEIEPGAELRRKLYAVPERKTKFRLNLDILLKPSLQPVFAAASVLLILFSFYMFNPDKKGIDRTINRTLHRGYSQFEKLTAKAGSLTETLGAYADNVVDSLRTINPLKRSDE
jgi:hypothetical protein